MSVSITTENYNENQSNFIFLFRKITKDIIFLYNTCFDLWSFDYFFFMTHSLEIILFLTKKEYCCCADLSTILVSILILKSVISIKEHVSLICTETSLGKNTCTWVENMRSIHIFSVTEFTCFVVLIWYKQYLLDLLNQGKHHLSCFVQLSVTGYAIHNLWRFYSSWIT